MIATLLEAESALRRVDTFRGNSYVPPFDSMLKQAAAGVLKTVLNANGAQVRGSDSRLVMNYLEADNRLAREQAWGRMLKHPHALRLLRCVVWEARHGKS